MRSLLLALSVTAIVYGQVNVLNVNYDTHQTGANLQETTLSPATNWSSFGKVGTYPVDGQVYAQPLYVSGVSIGGTKYNVLYVATMQNSVFAFNADFIFVVACASIKMKSLTLRSESPVSS